MQWKAILVNVFQKAKPFSIMAWQFIRSTFSDKKNILRFSLASVAVIITSQLMPGISIASFWAAFLLVIVMIALLISAKPLIAYFNLSFNILYFGVYLCIAYWLLIVFLDWAMWYLETENMGWVFLFSLIQAVFNSLIENLIEEE
jgi:putative membrane protein